MFYCAGCARERLWPFESWMGRSRGPCEVCLVTASCVDVHHALLPVPPPLGNDASDPDQEAA